MSLHVVACPEVESDVALAICALQAHNIPHLVHGGAMGTLLPGPQIAHLNARRIMVPEAFVEEARQVLAELAPPPAPRATPARVAAPSKLRIVLETFLLGWFVPRRDERP
jgi:hypothetical protein